MNDSHREPTPRIAVVIPNYNGSAFLLEAIESVEQQTLSPQQVIVVDDCSDDTSWQQLVAYARNKPHVHIYRNDKNKGIPQTRNALLSHIDSTIEYVALLDSDDCMEKDRLAMQVAFLSHNPDIDIVGSWVRVIDEHGVVIGHRTYPHTHEEIRRALLRVNPIAQSSVMLRASAIKAVGSYDETLQYIEDLDYWARVIAAGMHIANIPRALTRFRVHKRGGRFARSGRYLWLCAAVRARYVIRIAPFDIRVWGRIVAYAMASVLPQRVVVSVARVFFNGYE